MEALALFCMDKVRGVIRNREYATQVRDFSGLRYGNITPTDIDGFIEYKNKGFIVIESKFGNSRLTGGQRLAFERLVDALAKVKPSILIVGNHSEGSSNDIAIHASKVNEYRFKEVWKIPNEEITIRTMVDKFLAWLEDV